MTRSRRDDAPSDSSLLLSEADERVRQVVTTTSSAAGIVRCKVVLAACEMLPIGGDTHIGADWTNVLLPDGHRVGEIAVFAEGLLLERPFKAKNAVIAASSLVFADGASTISVAGERGAEPPASAGGTPLDGAPGEHGGTLWLYAEDVGIDDPPALDARGGEGGCGQHGDATKGGGNGGSGGKGGAVIAVLSHPARRWRDQLKEIHGLATADAKRALTKDLARRVSQHAGTDWISRTLADIQTLTEAQAINDAIKQLAIRLELELSDWTTGLKAHLDVCGGDPGPYGVGTPSGQPGPVKEDNDGQFAVKIVGADKAVDLASVPAFVVHPVQCAMVLEAAKLAYTFLDIGAPGAEQTMSDVVVALDRLKARTEAFVKLDPSSELAKCYAANERKYGAFAATDKLAAINSEATTLLRQIRGGYDVFGRPADYVPLTSLDTLVRDVVSPMLDGFKKVEDAYRALFAGLGKQTDTGAYIEQARSQMAYMAAQSAIDVPELLGRMTSAATIIDGYADILPGKKSAAQKAMEDYAVALGRTGAADFGELLGAAQQVAFSPKPLMMATALIQDAQLAYNANIDAKDVHGATINRAYIVRKVRAVEADIGALSEGIAVLNEGEVGLDDPGAAKLLADQQKFEAMLDEFYGSVPVQAAAAKAALDDYVRAVTARNTQVLVYNACVTTLLKYDQQAQDMAAQANTLDKEVIRELAADAPAKTAFMSQAYYAARSRILEYMNLAARAYRFWALDDGDLLMKSLGNRPPPDIDHAVLAEIQLNFWGQYALALGNMGTPAPFPDNDDDSGIIVRVAGPAINVFKSSGLAFVTVPPATPNSDPSHPFHKRAAVRIGEVRVWLEGVRVDNPDQTVAVDVTHCGHEQMVNPDGSIFSFSHSTLKQTFEYFPQRPRKKAAIFVPAVFECAAAGAHDKMAQVGPFTTWKIEVDAGTSGLLDGVTAILLEFRGRTLSFN